MARQLLRDEATNPNAIDRPVSYANGFEHAMTMGTFIQILIDSANTMEAVIVNVTREDAPDDNDKFIRSWNLTQIPDGQINKEIGKRHPQTVHKFLNLLLRKGHVT